MRQKTALWILTAGIAGLGISGTASAEDPMGAGELRENAVTDGGQTGEQVHVEQLTVAWTTANNGMYGSGNTTAAQPAVNPFSNVGGLLDPPITPLPEEDNGVPPIGEEPPTPEEQFQEAYPELWSLGKRIVEGAISLYNDIFGPEYFPSPLEDPNNF